MKRNSAPPSATSAVAKRGGVTVPGTAAVAPVGGGMQKPIRFSLTGKSVAVALVVAALLVFLLSVRSVLTPFATAVVVAYAFNPLVDWLVVRARLRRVWCVALPFLLGWGLLVWALVHYIPILNRETEQLATSISTVFPDLYQRFTNSVAQISVFGITINIQQQLTDAAAGFAEFTRSLGRQAVPFAGGFLDTLTQVFTFNIALFYLLLDGHRLGSFLGTRLPPHYHAELTGLAGRVDAVLGRYLRAQLLLIAIMAIASFIVLTVLGVRFAVPLALLAGFLEIFPIIGPTAAISLVSLVSFLQYENRFGLQQVTFALVVALIFFIMRQLEDYLVIPNIVGHVVNLHPVVILFVLFCGGHLAGILGMFLAVPITGALRIVLAYLYGKLLEPA
ncbi:MAG: AI-2E family transporter [Chloroflexota bacterium]